MSEGRAEARDKLKGKGGEQEYQLASLWRNQPDHFDEVETLKGGSQKSGFSVTLHVALL